MEAESADIVITENASTAETAETSGHLSQREIEENITSCLLSNHANTLPLLALMRTVDEARPFREVEDQAGEFTVMHMTHQSPHALADILLNCGAIEKIIVEENVPESSTEPAEKGDAQVSLEGGDDSDDDVSAADEQVELEDQPVDYLLHITPAGRAVLQDFEPVKRFDRLLSGEPETYFDAYKQVLSMCTAGKRFDEIEAALAGHPSLKDPKQIFPGYFVSKLETIGGIAWENDCWVTTEQGREMVALL